MSERDRVLVVWCPDWSVAAALGAVGLPRHLPAAVFETGRVQTCNQSARDLGVRRGMRRRDAQARCPELQVLGASPERDARSFEEVLATLERLRPGVLPLRPGLVALRSPGRFYGGEAEAGAVLAETLVAAEVWDVRIGVADDVFTAEMAARRAGIQQTLVIDDTTAFLRPLVVEVLDDAAAVDLLRRLGLRTLGELADLPEVRTRFGQQADWARRVIRGEGDRPVAGRTPPPDLTVGVGFEPPLESAEAVCFSARRAAERFVAQLGERQLVCTEVAVLVEADGVLASERAWLHPRWFTAVDLIDRLHWQLVGSLRVGSVRSAVESVRFVPQAVVAESVHADGLWGGTDARVERGIARVQGMLGHESVVAPVLQGGRSPAERQAFVPWGERPADLRPRELPWPGSIPPPAPCRVFAEPHPAEVIDASGRPVAVLERGGMSGAPTRYRPGPGEPWQPVAAWAGPWPVVERWWQGPEQRLSRFQLVGVDGRAWLAALDGAGRWQTEAAYD
jgi:protein ImuB